MNNNLQLVGNSNQDLSDYAKNASTQMPLDNIVDTAKNNINQSVTPNNISVAQQQLGNTNYNDLCQKFVEQMTMGRTGVYPSAIHAWNALASKAYAGLGGIKEGDVIYFAPNASNRGWGHTGIYKGNNQFISATDNGVQVNDLNNWQQTTGQQVLGFVPRESIGGQNATQ